MWRQTWTFLLVQMCSNSLNVKVGVFKKDDNKDFQLVQNFFSSYRRFNSPTQLRQGANFVNYTFINKVQRHGQPTETGSQGGCWGGLSKQIDIFDFDFAGVQCGQAPKLLCSSPFFSLGKSGKTNWMNLLFTSCNDFLIQKSYCESVHL